MSCSLACDTRDRTLLSVFFYRDPLMNALNFFKVSHKKTYLFILVTSFFPFHLLLPLTDLGFPGCPTHALLQSQLPLPTEIIYIVSVNSF